MNGTPRPTGLLQPERPVTPPPAPAMPGQPTPQQLQALLPLLMMLMQMQSNGGPSGMAHDVAQMPMPGQMPPMMGGPQ